ncbi:MAG: hypothetical protein AB8C02_06600 [Halioglobus sp.]
MSATKIIMLVVYAVLAVLAFTQTGSALGLWSLRILAVLAIAHVIEMFVFFKVCKEAGGSLPLHLLNVFLFGIVHANELKAAKAAA